MNSISPFTSIYHVLTIHLCYYPTLVLVPSAFAYKKGGHDRKDKGNDYGKYNANGNGNTVTVQVNKQNGKQSGHDNTFEQQAQNVICTHPSPSATCTGRHHRPGG